MPLPEPSFDTRTYRELMEEMLRRVPVHNPEWTNFNSEADPGTTLLQLVSFIAESVIYRANLIPERSRRKFLSLLGLSLQPALPGRGLVTFGMSGAAGAAPVVIQRRDEVLAGTVAFQPEQELVVHPVQSRVYYKRLVEGRRHDEIADVYNRLFASIREPAQSLVFYETVPLAEPAAGALVPSVDLADTADRSLWIAIFALQPDEVARQAARATLGSSALTLGVAPALDATAKSLFPAGPSAVDEAPRLIFEIPDVGSDTPGYRPLEVRQADDVLSEAGLVELGMPEADALRTWENLGPLNAGVGGYPPVLEDTVDAERLVTWIRVRAPAAGGQGGQTAVAFSWAGVNATRVVQRKVAQTERLPDGNGEPDQRARLVNTPVILDSVELTVNGERWLRVDDLADAGPEVPPKAPWLAAGRAQQLLQLPRRVFTVDRESGEIQFGDGARGTRPPRGALIACRYDFGGGLEGLVGIGAISGAPERHPDVKVTNPLPTWGAAARETIEQGEQRIHETLRHRNVMNTTADYVRITKDAPGLNVGRVDVLPLYRPGPPAEPGAGAVTLMVVPNPVAWSPDAEDARDRLAGPEGERALGALAPDRFFLETLCQYLEPRRILTTELHIRGPEYQPLAIGVGISPIPGVAEGPLLLAVRRAVLEFLSPLYGSFEGHGWPRERTVVGGEIAAAVTRVPGVAQITGVNLLRLDGTTLPDGLTISGLELPRAAAVRIAVGAAPTADEIFGGPPPSDEPPALPVPVVPEEC